MIGIESPETRSEVEQGRSTVHSVVAPARQATPLEFVLRVIAIGAGIALGAILALIIGLATGWIPFNC
jgi:hypothetical protein